MLPELRQLECFVAVAEESNFGRAAARLHMTQPPLTRRIRRLELDLGATLFLRTSRGVELTPPGSALLEHARRIIALTDRAAAVTQSAQAGELGELAVGYTGSAILDVVPRMLGAFLREHPGVSLRLERMPKDEQAAAIRDGRIHFGFARMYGADPDLLIIRIASERLYAALPGDHPLARRATLRVHDLESQPLILFPQSPRPSFADQVQQLMTSSGVTVSAYTEAEDVTAALAYVAVGAGVTVVAASAMNLRLPNVSFIPLKGAPEEDLSAMCRDDEYPPVVRSLVDFIRRWQGNERHTPLRPARSAG